MPLRALSYREVKRKLERFGFEKATQKGSHVKFIKRIESGTLTVIVPEHKEIAIGTLRSILRQARISLEEFEDL
ncbi:type II toxin-antitoxin system HicA family toxin [Leptospira noguchii]|uniref:Addiction module toxin, HicA family n=1 Tax=Leptospira santarosai TaxID=28183 RepID=A0AB73MKJ0_9LEPT|nr:type II toxin-antitoxin system HicA family toxin [Leptospira santarosai]MCH1911610.1 type II toxin-antitoxin system HicA family toxin [Leptospira noguchii]MBW9233813.1 type II toxin-antitoxin system HicA family toxin [Leptospira santarosai]MCH1911627.1 type II toxin-antitoxin system HicA family toxin [Leptospira noguchii]MCH1914688.1 type II toxin-antitoxin system HicA family toxin [Leptospira noguchii]MCH1914709.1 type II toxin-antitoxin system HicA family toxin [Leptospira noguchii]